MVFTLYSACVWNTTVHNTLVVSIIYYVRVFHMISNLTSFNHHHTSILVLPRLACFPLASLTRGFSPNRGCWKFPQHQEKFQGKFSDSYIAKNFRHPVFQ